MKTKTRVLHGITKSMDLKKGSVKRCSYETHELPMLTTHNYVSEHKRVTERKRKLNRELKQALKVMKKYEFE